MVAGRLSGIARHNRPHGVIEVLDSASITREAGLVGDARGALKGAPYRRQISLIERQSWDAAATDAGVALPWHVRRANLLVEGLRIPREPGTWLRIGDTCVIEVTCECDPCARMDAIADGLRKALEPDWRGGFLGKVVSDGDIATGDTIRIEQ